MIKIGEELAQKYNYPIDTAAMLSYVEQANFPEGKIWIGQDDFLPYKISFEKLDLVPPSELAANYPGAKATISLSMQFSNFNQITPIKAPTSWKSVEEVMKSFMMASSTSL